MRVFVRGKHDANTVEQACRGAVVIVVVALYKVALVSVCCAGGVGVGDVVASILSSRCCHRLADAEAADRRRRW